MSSASAVVVDASVALKWAFDDEDSVEAAVALRDDAISGAFEMLAPSLWIYEVGNAVVTSVRRSRLTERQGLTLLQNLIRVGVRLVDPEPLDSVRLALRHGLSGYDASYVALALTLDVILWTGDRALCAAVDDANAVRLIGDYPSE